MSKYQGPVFHKKLQTERSQTKPSPREVKRTQQPTIEQNHVPFYKTHEPKQTFETPVKQKQTTAKNDSIYEDRTSTPFKVTHVPPSFFGTRKKKEEEQDQINYQVIFQNLSKKDDEFLLFDEYLSDYGEEQVARREAQLNQTTEIEEQNSAQMEPEENEIVVQETKEVKKSAHEIEPGTDPLSQEVHTPEPEVEEVVEEEPDKRKEPKKRGLSRSLAGMIQEEQDPVLNKGRNIARYFGETLQNQQIKAEPKNQSQPATISELLAQSRNNQTSSQLESLLEENERSAKQLAANIAEEEELENVEVIEPEVQAEEHVTKELETSLISETAEQVEEPVMEEPQTELEPLTEEESLVTEEKEPEPSLEVAENMLEESESETSVNTTEPEYSSQPATITELLARARKDSTQDLSAILGEDFAMNQEEPTSETETVIEKPVDFERKEVNNQFNESEVVVEDASEIEETVVTEPALESETVVETSVTENNDTELNEDFATPEKTVVVPSSVEVTEEASEERFNQAVEAEVETETAVVMEEPEPLKPYEFPSIGLLQEPVKFETSAIDDWVLEQAEALNETLEAFNVEAQVVGWTIGPAITQFELQLGRGVKVNKITNLADDLKLSLAAKDIRIEAPIPGKSTVGVEVPNKKSRPVMISEVLESEAFKESESPLTIALGVNLAGETVVTTIDKMPHGLIAGATGSGKSVFINSLLVSLLYKATPNEVKLILIDPKAVELAPYNGLPHLLSPVISEPKAANEALKWAVVEMEERYQKLAAAGVRNIEGFNKKAEKNGDHALKIPYIVIIIDELADLMMVASNEVQDSIARITQKARAAGIHLIVATQRPSVDVVTGTIKNNIPTRVAFMVSSQIDSRTILDNGGAEKLLGRGDMLFQGNGSSRPVRLQGTFVEDEIDDIVDFVKEQQEANYLFQSESLLERAEELEDKDELLDEVLPFIVDQGTVSASALQRKFRIGFNRASNLIDKLESKNLISGNKGSKPRDVFLTRTDYEEKFM